MLSTMLKLIKRIKIEKSLIIGLILKKLEIENQIFFIEAASLQITNGKKTLSVIRKSGLLNNRICLYRSHHILFLYLPTAEKISTLVIVLISA
jgi:hypothetical protein